MVATIRKGYAVTVEGKPWRVIGSRSLRKVYFYILQDANGKRASINRNTLLTMQHEGTATVTL